MSTLVERLDALIDKFGLMYDDYETICEAAAALRATGEGEWEYYYRQSDCPAADNAAADCVCWHPEGTGPFANEQHDAMDSTLEWRRAAAPTPAEPTNPGEISSKVVGPLRDAGAVDEVKTLVSQISDQFAFNTEAAYAMDALNRLATLAAHHAPARVDEAARWFAGGPEGHFYTNDRENAVRLLDILDPTGDDWTLTDLAAAAQEKE